MQYVYAGWFVSGSGLGHGGEGLCLLGQRETEQVDPVISDRYSLESGAIHIHGDIHPSILEP